MKVTSAEFIKSAFQETDWTNTKIPEIAFLGRSNVGKSSLINTLLGVRGLARTSNTPGRTQCLNFFLINKKFHFVDFPGYGYARVPKKIREEWGELAENYLAKRTQLVLSIQLVDSRHTPTNQDLQLSEWLKSYAKPCFVVATKADKLSKHELRRNIENARKMLNVEHVIPYSSITRAGHNDVWKVIRNAIENFGS